MPPIKSKKKLIDIIEDEFARDYNWIFDKYMVLLGRIQSHNPSIDNSDLRWIENKIYEYDEGGVFPNKEELKYANDLLCK